VARVAACRNCGRAGQQSASPRISGDHFQADRIEVLPRFLIAPCRIPWGNGVQPHGRAHRLTGYASRAATALGCKNRLDACFKVVEIERLCCRWRRLLGNRWLSEQQHGEGQQGTEFHEASPPSGFGPTSLPSSAVRNKFFRT